jgi:hypothetical protein
VGEDLLERESLIVVDQERVKLELTKMIISDGNGPGMATCNVQFRSNGCNLGDETRMYEGLLFIAGGSRVVLTRAAEYTNVFMCS